MDIVHVTQANISPATPASDALAGQAGQYALSNS
jgi:hypothetical protein